MKKNIFKFLKLILLMISLFVVFILFSLIWNYYSGIPLPSEEDKSIYHTGILIEQYEPQVKEARLVLDKWKNQFYTPGYSIAVGYEDQVIWSEAFGYSDLEQKIPARVGSKFPIGSVTKTFTAMAIMDLVEQGKIELKNKIQEYVPSFPEKKHPINIEQLLAHTSGIRHYKPIIKWPPPYFTIDSRLDDTFETTEQKLALFANDSLLFKPGSKYSYSTYGYTLLGEVIESVTEMSYNSYMSETMFKPLDMTNTTPDYFNHKIKNRVVSYNNTIIGSRVLKSEKENCGYKWV